MLQNAGWRDLLCRLSAHVAARRTCLVIGSTLLNLCYISGEKNAWIQHMLRWVLTCIVLPQQVCNRLPCLPPSTNSLFFWNSGTFQRLNGFNEPQCCASGGCWVSGMKLMIMCPAECHYVFPTVMVIEAVWVFFFFFFPPSLLKAAAAFLAFLFAIPAVASHFHVCIELSPKYIMPRKMHLSCISCKYSGIWKKNKKRTSSLLFPPQLFYLVGAAILHRCSDGAEESRRGWREKDELT